MGTHERDRGAQLLCESAIAIKAAVDLPLQGQCEPPDTDAWFQRMKDAGIDTLVLGCTHYPLLRGVLAEELGPEVRLVDSAEATAAEVDALLGQGVAGRAPPGTAALRVYVTDTPERIPELSARFLGERVERAEHVDI